MIWRIESREAEVVSKWLKKFRNIKRWKSNLFKSNHSTVQISDYFYLIKNLCNYLKEYLLRKLPKLIEIDVFFAKKY